MNESMKKFLVGKECACCNNPATDYEPRFNYFTCDVHRNVPPVEVGRLKDLKRTNKE